MRKPVSPWGRARLAPPERLVEWQSGWARRLGDSLPGRRCRGGVEMPQPIIRPAAPDLPRCPNARTIAGSELLAESELDWQQWAAAHPLAQVEVVLRGAGVQRPDHTDRCAEEDQP